MRRIGRQSATGTEGPANPTYFMKTKVIKDSSSGQGTPAEAVKATKAAKGQATSPPVHDAIFLGLDLHSGHIRVVRQTDQSNPQPAQRLNWDADWRPGKAQGILGYAQRQLSLAKKVYAVYEAGAFGFRLCRELQALGIECYVTKPCKLDPEHRRVQTDKTDARELADRLERYVRGNTRAMVVVTVPTPEQEAQRSEARHRHYLQKELQSVRAHGRGVLLSQGFRYVQCWWQEGCWKELAPKLSEQVRAALEDCRKLIELYEQLLPPVEAKLKASAPQELPVGFGALTFVLLRREIYQWERFGTRRKVACFTGLCGGVSSSGPAHFDLSITKVGNRRLRTLLVELAWRMVFYQPEYKPVKKWEPILRSQSKGQRRQRKRAIVAVARQLAVDIWKWQTGKITPEQLGWRMPKAK